MTTPSHTVKNAEHLQYVPAPDDPLVAGLGRYSARDFAAVRAAVPMLVPVIAGWRRAFDEPFVGVTTDGRVRTDVYDLGPVQDDERGPRAAMRAAAERVRDAADAQTWETLTYPLESPLWRGWSNPEFLIFDNGVRLEEQDEDLRRAILALVEASLSERGFTIVRNLMALNGYLGDLIGLPAIMNEHSYQFAVYGDPFGDAAWGWQLFGHHVALNVLLAGDRMTIGPVFLGAEPDSTPEGRDAGTRVLEPRERFGLEFIRSLTPAQLLVAQEYDRILDPAIPPERWNPADGRHLAGAFADNAVIPLQGISGAELDDDQRARLLAICVEYSGLLPVGPRAARTRELERWIDETFLTWIGGIGDDDAFYYRVQSPVIVAEFDHHQGMWLTNEEPARFHTHTTLRLPNGNDYGSLLR